MAQIPDPADRPTLTVTEAGAILGWGRSKAYAAVAAGDIPSIRSGSRAVVPTAALRQLLGLDPPITDEQPATVPIEVHIAPGEYVVKIERIR